MKLIITAEGKLHLQSINNPDPQEVASRQELRISVEFADSALIDGNTATVAVKLKVSRTAEDLAASVTLARVNTTNVYAGFLNLGTSVLNALADGTPVFIECTWLLATKQQRSDPRQIIIRQAVVSGDEGAPEADQSIATRLDWLTSYITAGDNITITEDTETGAIVITGESGSGSVAWADITGKPTEFTPAAHTQAISTITGLQSALDGKAATSHGHAIADTTGLQAALDAKAPLASPTFTGVPAVPTASGGTNTTQAASTAFVASALAGLVLGKVLQMRMAELATDTTTGSTTQVECLSQEVIPLRADSTIVVLGIVAFGGTAGQFGFFQIRKGASGSTTLINPPTGFGSRTPVHAQVVISGGTAINIVPVFAAEASGDTNARTYRLVVSGTSTWWLNRPGTDNNTSAFTRGLTKLIIFEVAP